MKFLTWLSHPEAWLVVVLALVTCWIVMGLARRDKSAASRINVEDLLLGEDGRLSKSAAVMMGSFLLTSWFIVFQTLMGTMTEGYLGIYVTAWVGPTVTKLIKGSTPTPPETQR